MRRSIAFTAYCACLLLLSSCKKDYPEGLPGWLTARIDHCAKKRHDCGSLQVLEYEGLGRTWYYLNQRDTGSDELYTAEGSLTCSGHNIFIDESQCAAVVLDSLHPVRLVWTED